MIRGVVTSFDAQTGLGAVTSVSGEILTFHAVSIADDTRTVAVGTHVFGIRRTGRVGEDEIEALQSYSGS